MITVAPKAILVGETKINGLGLNDLIQHLGVAGWRTDAASDAETLIEVAGKLCYMSFAESLNDNLTRVGARNNFDYIQEGLVATEHGSVLEHCTVNIVALNVSRILTHELVRHRVGAAYSQQSGRYVRTNALHMYIPPEIIENNELLKEFIATADMIQKQYEKLVEISGINDLKDFGLKKRLTSALRRIRPNGESNAIMFTFNHRTLRTVIAQRTSVHAEEEIRILFNQVFNQVATSFPAIYADAVITKHELTGRANIIEFKHNKI